MCGSAGVSWLADSTRIVFTGDAGDGKPRGYIQDIPAGLPRAITPIGVSLAGKATVRDDRSVLGRIGPTWKLFPIAGGEAEPVPALERTDIPIQWSHDGRYVYTVNSAGDVTSPAFDVVRVELTTGARVLWKTLSPLDPVGAQSLRATLEITPDARSVLLLLHATAWRPVRRRRAQVTPSNRHARHGRSSLIRSPVLVTLTENSTLPPVSTISANEVPEYSSPESETV